MRPVRVGLVVHLVQTPGSKETPSWDSIRRIATEAEQVGVDTVWIYDELIYDVEAWGGLIGAWECVAVAGAVCEATSNIEVGTWVLSALHRNAGLTAKVAATLDEISGGRFIFGFGSGYHGVAGTKFGFPSDKIVSRYEEALQVVVPLMRDGSADFDGRYHRARDLVQVPSGPRPGGTPIMLAGNGPRTIGLAVDHADIWSAFASKSSKPEAFEDLVELVNRICEEKGRDPSTLGRSVGVMVEFGEAKQVEQQGMGVPVSGSVGEIADSMNQFAEMGFTSVEMNMFPGSIDLEPVAELLTVLDGD